MIEAITQTVIVKPHRIHRQFSKAAPSPFSRFFIVHSSVFILKLYAVLVICGTLVRCPWFVVSYGTLKWTWIPRVLVFHL
jgi:hypothetical protein